MSNLDSQISELLKRSRTIAVVGLSEKNNRPSHEVAHYLQKNGYRIIPVNPAYAGTHILDELCYSTLQEAAAALSKENARIDIVDCFRKPEAMLPIAEDAININTTCIWMQLGVANEDAAARARAKGIAVVMNHCIKIEHMQRL